MQNTPYLVGNTFRRDHIFGLTVTKAKWLAAGWSWPPYQDVPCMHPIGMTLEQLMTIACRVKTWQLSGGGLRPHAEYDGGPVTNIPWTSNTQLIHARAASPTVQAEKTILVRAVADLRDEAGRGYLDNWEHRDPPDHLPFLFTGPELTQFLWRVDHTQPALLLAMVRSGVDGSDGFTPFNNCAITIYDEATKLFWPYFRFQTPGGLAGPTTPTNPDFWGSSCGTLTVSAEGMTPFVVTCYLGASVTMTLEALTYW